MKDSELGKLVMVINFLQKFWKHEVLTIEEMEDIKGAISALKRMEQVLNFRRYEWTLGVLSATGKNEEIIFTVIGVKKKSRRKKKELRKNGKEVYLNGGKNE